MLHDAGVADDERLGEHVVDEDVLGVHQLEGGGRGEQVAEEVGGDCDGEDNDNDDHLRSVVIRMMRSRMIIITT